MNDSSALRILIALLLSCAVSVILGCSEDETPAGPGTGGGSKIYYVY